MVYITSDHGNVETSGVGRPSEGEIAEERGRVNGGATLDHWGGVELDYLAGCLPSIVAPNTFSSVRASPAGDQIVFRTQTVVQW
jgi:hypothetical protein